MTTTTRQAHTPAQRRFIEFPTILISAYRRKERDIAERETVSRLVALRGFYHSQFETLSVEVAHLPSQSDTSHQRRRHRTAMILLSLLLACSIIAMVLMLVALKLLYF